MTIITREELYRLLCAAPKEQVARQLGVSGTYLGRVCTALDVPRPPPGWWNKRRAGVAPPLPPLPPARTGHPVQWSRKGCGTAPIAQFHRRHRLWALPRACGMHPLSVYAVEIFGSAKPAPGGSVLITRARFAIDMTITAEAVDRAIASVNALFMALERQGHAVEIAAGRAFIRPPMDGREGPLAHLSETGRPAWAPLWPTIATISQVPIGLAVLEIHEAVEMQYAGHGTFERPPQSNDRRAPATVGITWREKRWSPTGRLKLVAYSPVHSVPWRREWRLTSPEDDEAEIDGLVRDLEEAASALACELAPLVAR